MYFSKKEVITGYFTQARMRQKAWGTAPLIGYWHMGDIYQERTNSLFLRIFFSFQIPSKRAALLAV